jgi:hypothetical protein
MRIAKIYDHTLEPGTEIEIPGVHSNFKFFIIEVEESAFKVRWSGGPQDGEEDRVPFSMFPMSITTCIIPEDKNEPNYAFLRRRLING